MQSTDNILLNGNQAAAQIAYQVNDSCVIYPITPATEMSELVEQWSAQEITNMNGNIPTVIEMQSEAGVGGTMHGALQTGITSTTFTASQGLLLMMPNMYRIAGELSPNVIHVATRSIATHALSVFGDHSDIMAVRSTGYAFLAANSVQEVMDFAIIAQAASLRSRIPFVHFFDGFRTSHEISTVKQLPNSAIEKMIDPQSLQTFRERALNPENPFIRGTSQGPDVFFQSREAIGPYYKKCPQIVAETMYEFGQLTGRHYQPFEYCGDPEADRIIVAMGSACETIEQTVNHLNKSGEKTGVIKVRLFRPFSTEHLLDVIPHCCKKIAVLDRTKEPGSTGEPLYLDIVSAMNSKLSNEGDRPLIIGGRYGLSSKEFTPAMVKTIFDELLMEQPKNNFTVGIYDDLMHTGLDHSKGGLRIDNGYEILLCCEKNETNSESFRHMLDRIKDHNNIHLQAYTECTYKKSKSKSTTHLRVHSESIKAPYLIEKADLIVCEGISSLQQSELLNRLKENGILVIMDSIPTNTVWNGFEPKQQKQISDKKVRVYYLCSAIYGSFPSHTKKKIIPLHRLVLALNSRCPDTEIQKEMAKHLVLLNGAILSGKLPDATDQSASGPNKFLAKLLEGKGESLPVSAFPPDGSFPSNTSGFKKNEVAEFIPDWNMDSCTQCGACSIACPLAALRAKAIETDKLEAAPEDFDHKPLEILEGNNLGMAFSIQINPDQCDGCNQCVDACPENALQMEALGTNLEMRRANWSFMENMPETDPVLFEPDRIEHLALSEPLFKYPDGDSGCGQAPYLKMLSQLFGDHMLIANATGSSSIFGGALPTTPWSHNKEGRGPAWSNSLFEDNAEFGLGFRISLDQQNSEARRLLSSLQDCPDIFDRELILNSKQETRKEIRNQRERVDNLKTYLKGSKETLAAKLYPIADNLVKKSVWIVGGDGWAYDVGYGGLDHAISTGRNINILILDNEVYDNTGGQMSKSTPMGAAAKFAWSGKKRKKKDMGQILMSYEDVYVASVSIGADQEHTLKAILEAESYDGPSVIIAYCHSKAHGIDMTRPVSYHKSLVESGRWLLYRHDPRRAYLGMNPLQLDSSPPVLPVNLSLEKEDRFRRLFQLGDNEFNKQLEEIQTAIDKRYMKYSSMAGTGRKSTLAHLN